MTSLLPNGWHYGPTPTDPDPGKMWHYVCGGEVLSVDGGNICCTCGQQWDESGKPVPGTGREPTAHGSEALVAFLRQRYTEIGANAERMRDAVWPAEVHVWPKDNTGTYPLDAIKARVTIAPQYTKRYATIWESDRGLPHVEDSWHMFTGSVAVWSEEVAEEILADVDAKMAVVAACVDTLEWERGNADAAFAAKVLKLLALPFADHRDYREGWKP